MALLTERPDILARLRCVAFTDAVHHVRKQDQVAKFLKEKARNWVQSRKPLDTPEPKQDASSGCVCVSAGTESHERTSSSAIDSVFSFLDKHIQ